MGDASRDLDSLIKQCLKGISPERLLLGKDLDLSNEDLGTLWRAYRCSMVSKLEELAKHGHSDALLALIKLSTDKEDLLRSTHGQRGKGSTRKTKAGTAKGEDTEGSLVD